MEQWDYVYNSGFKIDTKEPARVVKNGLKNIPANSKILDVGCGNGRNSLYAAGLGYTVDAIDLVDLRFLEDSSQEIMDRVSFYKKSVWDFDIKKEFYRGVVMTRLIQYFSPDELPRLLNHTLNGLSFSGLLMLNYTASGGVPQEVLRINKSKHGIGRVVELLNKEHMRIANLEKGTNRSTNVPYDFPAETYEILAVKHRGSEKDSYLWV
jgi:SAM-dependent methyltransferase